MKRLFNSLLIIVLVCGILICLTGCGKKNNKESENDENINKEIVIPNNGENNTNLDNNISSSDLLLYKGEQDGETVIELLHELTINYLDNNIIPDIMFLSSANVNMNDFDGIMPIENESFEEEMLKETIENEESDINLQNYRTRLFVFGLEGLDTLRTLIEEEHNYKIIMNRHFKDRIVIVY